MIWRSAGPNRELPQARRDVLIQTSSVSREQEIENSTHSAVAKASDSSDKCEMIKESRELSVRKAADFIFFIVTCTKPKVLDNCQNRQKNTQVWIIECLILELKGW